MVPLWFTLSALCFVGAAVLLYVDIDRRRGRGRRRKSWARSHGFDYEQESTEILKRWKRGVMSTVGSNIPAHNVVLGQIRGEAVFIFDLEEVATVIALHRKVGTNVVVDVRLKGLKEPRENDNLAARGDRAADGVFHQPGRRPSRVRPPHGHLRAHRARLCRDHVERAELDAGQHADRQHPRSVGRRPAHGAPIQRLAAGTAAGPAIDDNASCAASVRTAQGVPQPARWPPPAAARLRSAMPKPPPVKADPRRAPQPRRLRVKSRATARRPAVTVTRRHITNAESEPHGR